MAHGHLCRGTVRAHYKFCGELRDKQLWHACSTSQLWSLSIVGRQLWHSQVGVHVTQGLFAMVSEFRIRVEDLRIAALQEKFSTDSERVRRSFL